MFRKLFHTPRKAHTYICLQLPGNFEPCLNKHYDQLCRLIANKAQDLLNQFEHSLNSTGIKLAIRCSMGLSKESRPITDNLLGLDGCKDLKLRSTLSQQVAKDQDGTHPAQSTYTRAHSSKLAEHRCLAQSVFHGPLAQAKQLLHKVNAGEKPYWFSTCSKLL